MQQPDWLDWAWRELGVQEVEGKGDNPRIVEMFKAVGHQAITDDEVAWCAAFLGACLERSGRPSTHSLMARSYLTWGQPEPAARYGAVAVLSRGANPALGHVGYVLGETEGQVFLLGGNQSNSVSVAAFEKSRVLGYRWPDDEAAGDARLSDLRKIDLAESASTDTAQISEENGALENMLIASDAQFVRALDHVLLMEGGFSDDPYDPGGPTNKGITLSVFAKWVGEPITSSTRNRLVARLKRIPDAMVREIYRTRYWQPADCTRMPPALALMHFDTAVNHGVGRAIRILQQAVGADIDGEIGPQTRARTAAHPAAATLIAYAEIRREHYRSLKHFWRFGKGWMRRVDHTLLQSGTLMAQAASAAEDAVTIEHRVDVEATNRKGDTDMTTESIEPQDTAKWWGESLTIWGVIVTALSTVLPVVGPLFGLEITAEMVRQLGGQLTEIIQALGGVIGTLLTIYGRVRATQPITRRLVAVKL